MPFRRALFSALLLSAAFAPAAFAEEEHHIASAGEIRIVHPWTRAASAGTETLAFMQIDNAGAADVLVSARSDAAASVAIVGVTFTDGKAGVQPVGELEIPSGETMLDPKGLALQLTGLTSALEKGGEVEIELTFRDAGEIHLHLEIEAADATRHSHAGHAH